MWILLRLNEEFSAIDYRYIDILEISKDKNILIRKLKEEKNTKEEEIKNLIKYSYLSLKNDEDETITYHIKQI